MFTNSNLLTARVLLAVFLFFGIVPAPAHAKALANCNITNLAAAPTRQIASRRFTVEVRGNGPDVVFIAGMGTPRAVWNDTVQSLAGCYRVHTVQLRGFGDAARANASGPVLRPFVDGLSVYLASVTTRSGKAPVVVGHSMGGLAGLMISQAHPNVISKLVMIDAVPSFAVLTPGLGGADGATIANAASQMRAAIVSRYGKPPNTQEIEASVSGMSLNPASVNLMRQWSQSADARVVGQAIYDDLTTDMRPQLSSINTPVVVMAAWHGGMPFSESQVLGFFQRQFTGLQNVQVLTVSPSAHFIMLDQPDMFLGALGAVLTQ
jgi:pimeloyl-ACP methyl ester carboxylesterase